MNIDMNKIGCQIASLRKAKGLTQNELGERLGISFQAVSKWERGETLPDVSLLVGLANILETSVDHILRGGEKIMNYRGKITVADMKEGIKSLEKVGELLGKDTLIYRSAIEGINTRMDTDIEEAFRNENIFECFVAEAIIQNLMAGAYIDLSDVKNNFKYEHYSKIVCEYAQKYDIQ